MKAVAVLLLLGSVAVLKVAADNAAELAAAASSKDKHDYEKDKHGRGQDYGHHKNHHGYKGPHYGGKDEYYGNKGPHYGGKDEYYGSKDPYYGGKDEYYGGKEEYYGGKDDYYGGLPPYDYGYGYTEPSYSSYGEYDYGYHGGPPGRQIIHLDLVDEDDDVEWCGSKVEDNNPSVARGGDKIKIKFSFTCGVKHHPYGYADSYYGDKVTETFPSPDEIPILGKGKIKFDLDEDEPAKLGKHWWGSVRGDAEGEMCISKRDREAAGRCNPILETTKEIEYEDLEVVFVPAKIDLKATPYILDNLIHVKSRGERRREQRRSNATSTIQGKAKSASPAKLSAASIPQEYYDDDGLLCGMAILAKGRVKIKQFRQRREKGGDSRTTYKGTIWFTLYWTNGVLEIPSWFGEQWAEELDEMRRGSVDNSVTNTVEKSFIGRNNIQIGNINGFFLGDGGEEITELLHKWCKFHKETMLVQPGKVTIDVAPVNSEWDRD